MFAARSQNSVNAKMNSVFYFKRVNERDPSAGGPWRVPENLRQVLAVFHCPGYVLKTGCCSHSVCCFALPMVWVAETLLYELTAIRLVQIFHVVVDMKCLSQSLHSSVTGAYPEPVKSILHPHKSINPF